jgi:glycosyltransferase involved in cell wall biosynthesis
VHREPADAVNEIVVVDTGFDDGTKRVAQQYTAKIYDLVWRDDFGAARQFAFDRATSDWVIWVDADDVVRHADRIKPLLAAAPPDVCCYYCWGARLSRPTERTSADACTRRETTPEDPKAVARLRSAGVWRRRDEGR